MSLRRRALRGACQIALFLLVAAGYLFWSGGQGIWTAVTNWSPTEIPCAQYVKEKPGATWLRLKGCFLDLTEARFSTNSKTGAIVDVYIPVRPVEEREQDERGPIHVVLATKDPEILDLARRIDAATDEAAAVELVMQNADKIFQTRDMEGMVLYGADLDSDDRQKLAGLGGLTKDFVMLEEGKKPSLVWSFVKLAGGLVCLVLALVLSGRGGNKEEAPPAA